MVLFGAILLLQSRWLDISFVQVDRDSLALRLMDAPNIESEDDPDAHCIFRQSPLYRKVFVYPSPGTEAFQNNHSGVVTNAGAPLFPWEAMDAKCKQMAQCGYDLFSQLMQVRLVPHRLVVLTVTATVLVGCRNFLLGPPTLIRSFIL